jgi:hypothetical protein
MPMIYSTLGNSTSYAIYEPSSMKDAKSVATVRKSIEVKGGAGIANKNLVTPKGVVTRVSAEDLELLKNDPHFQQHVKRGFITVDEGEDFSDDPSDVNQKQVDKRADDMNPNDKSKPLTSKDFKGTNPDGTSAPSPVSNDPNAPIDPTDSDAADPTPKSKPPKGSNR